MAMTPPTNEDLAAIAARYRLGLGDADVEEFRAIITGALASYDEVERLYVASLPEPPDRPYRWPDPARERTGRLVRHHRDQDGRRRPAGRPPGRDQGQHRGGRAADDERVRHGRGVRAAPGRHRGHPAARRGGDDHRQGRVRGPVLLRRQPHLADRPGAATPGTGRRSAGGSSSGSAALVAAGHADMALGGDQGGSVRIPSAFCGTVGHKPTHGLVPYTGAFPIENTLDHLGPITRTVRDAALHARRAGRPGRARPAPAGGPPGRRTTSPTWTRVSPGSGSPWSRRDSASPACRSPGSTRPSAPPSHAWRRPARRQRDQPPVAPRRAARVERHRHRRRDQPDDRRQRVRDERPRPV